MQAGELHSRIHESDLPFQTAAKWVAMPVTHRLPKSADYKGNFISSVTPFPQAHQKNHSGFKKRNIYNSSIHLPFNFTVLLEYFYLLKYHDKDIYNTF